MTGAWDERESERDLRALPLVERAAMMKSLMREPGWRLLVQMLTSGLRGRIRDQDSREAFLYEAIRVQAMQEMLALPAQMVRRAQRLDGVFGEAARFTFSQAIKEDPTTDDKR